MSSMYATTTKEGPRATGVAVSTAALSSACTKVAEGGDETAPVTALVVAVPSSVPAARGRVTLQG